MKRLLFLVILIGQVLGQSTPPTYPYPKPLPTSGAAPPASIKLTGPANTVGYGDNRAATWDVFFGGGYRSVGTTTERDSILAGRRKQGMLVWVADTDHTYKLATNLTSWVDLGILGNSINIYNTDGTMTANRHVAGAFKDLYWDNFHYIGISSDFTFSDRYFQNLIDLDTNHVSLDVAIGKEIIFGTSDVHKGTNVNGKVWMANNAFGRGEWTTLPTPSITTIYTGDGTLAGDRNVDADSHSIVIGTGSTASGNAQAIIGGTGNTIDGSNVGAAILGGVSNTIDDLVGGFNSAVIVGGSGNYISNGDFAAVIGGAGNTADEDYTLVHGYQAQAKHYGAEASASGAINNPGDNQKVELQLRGVTDSGTPVVLTLDGLTLLPSIRDAGTTWLVTMDVVAKTSGTGSGKSAAFRRTFQIDRPAGEATTTLQGSVQTIGSDSGSNAGSPPASWGIVITADTTNSGFTATFTGDGAADAIFIHANVTINQLIFP
jgi:hypothetical protein